MAAIAAGARTVVAADIGTGATGWAITDWHNAERVDYRRYRLRQPPRGYEWRRDDDRFVLVAVTTGVIMSVILRNGR